MYTEEQVKFYLTAMLTEGLTFKAAQDRWGVPSRNTLSIWMRRYEAGEIELDLPRVRGACEHAKHAPYPAGTRDEAVRLYRAGEKPSHIARRLGLRDPGLPAEWSRARERARMAVPGAKGAPLGKAARVAVDRELESEVERLRAQNEELLGRLDLLVELMRDPKADGPANLSSRLRTEFGERLRAERGWPLRDVLTILRMSKSTYEYNRARLAAGPDPDEAAARDALDAAVLGAFLDSGRRYGYRRLTAQLKAEGVPCSERAVRRSVARQGLRAKRGSDEKRWSSYKGEISDAPANLMLDARGRHDFSAPAPNVRWLTDITELRGRDAKLYVSVIIDCYDGRVVAWRQSGSPDAELANSTLEDAVARLAPGEAPTIHSDRGCHYRWPGWVGICESAGLARSMSKKGHSPDNSACEGFFGRAKVECLHELVRAGATAAELAAAVEGYMGWYNSARLKAFRDVPGRISYETIDGRRRRLGLAL